MNCEHKEYRYLDCDECRENETECIYVCTECGEEA